ncbi:DUF455 family protein [Paenibacillus qinlingensis]|uniref:DUF455 family protein n=1 Tax=Paenibacillus qinlingensis TaxID=1837343 RepID=A0ABU1P0J7_9BACL|nr:DUF455 family protein [Paenibacillus qinlingensis]MDR6553269.1 hypothetical protein [Paenibacillus qinlingensis]
MDANKIIMVDVNDVGFLDNTENRTGAFIRPVDTALMLKDCYWIEFELSRLAMGWVTAAPNWEWKGELVRMGYLHTEHMKKLRQRIDELPGAALSDRSWTPERVAEVFLAVSLAPAFAEFALAYRSFVSKLYNRYTWLADALDPILEEPTLDALRVIELDRKRLIDWADPHVRFAYVDDSVSRMRFDSWRQYVDRMWDEMFTKGGSPATDWAERLQHPPAGPVPANPAVDPKYPHVDLTKYKSAMFDPNSPTYDSVKHMIFINASEMSATESLTYLYYGVQKMPMDFYHDIARHTWDEARHSQMGVRRLKQLGYRTEDFSWHPSTALTPDNLERTFPEFYSSLTMVMEPCSFIKKRKSVESFKDHGDNLSSLQSEYDIADERMHVQFGKRWGAKLFEHIDDFVTAQSVAEKAKQLHLEKMGYSQSEINGVLKSFPEFCGFATMDLKYDRY